MRRQGSTDEPVQLLPRAKRKYRQIALRGSLEVFDLAHPAGQWVPSGENLGHHFHSVEAQRVTGITIGLSGAAGPKTP